ncbi:hypothetical protein D3C71_2211060 [compost metagenome]
MQVGAWQLSLLGDIPHGGGAVALLGKHLFRRLQDFFDIASADFDLVIGHQACAVHTASS